MVPPFISYLTFNRLGLTARNLPALLSGTEDFELHIIDCNSKDDTWDYIMSLSDSRIKTKERFELNHGKPYALNMHLLRRQPEQYFFALDNSVYIETKGWIGKFTEVFKGFPEVGLLGVVPAGNEPPQCVQKSQGAVSYQELCCSTGYEENNCIPDYFMCLKPELLKEIGYFSEENCFSNIELTYRVCNHTEFKAGLMTNVRIQRLLTLGCDQCALLGSCKLDKVINTCFTNYDKYNKDAEFMQKNRWRFEETVRDMQSGARPAYCASLLDAVSANNHIYNRDWAMSNLMYYVKNAN